MLRGAKEQRWAVVYFFRRRSALMLRGAKEQRWAVVYCFGQISWSIADSYDRSEAVRKARAIGQDLRLRAGLFPGRGDVWRAMRRDGYRLVRITVTATWDDPP